MTIDLFFWWAIPAVAMLIVSAGRGIFRLREDRYHDACYRVTWGEAVMAVVAALLPIVNILWMLFTLCDWLYRVCGGLRNALDKPVVRGDARKKQRSGSGAA